MKNLLAEVLIAVSLFLVPTRNVGAACDPRTVAQARTKISCGAPDDVCRAWRVFRDAHPFPYQTIAVGAGNELVILSEVPPIAPPDDVTELAKAVFEGYSPRTYRLRYPIGHDGWLEDLVVSLKPVSGATTKVPAADRTTIEMPHGLANRLQYLYGVLFGSPDNFYVDRVSAPAETATLGELQVTAADLKRLIADSNRTWRSLASPDLKPIAWADLEKNANAKASAYVDDSESVVVLAVPKGTNVDSIRDDFRRFAVNSDYIIGAERSRGGGLLLFGRERQVPLSVLPPLRFETVASLASSLGQPLGQSYERQRVLAGKIQSGDFGDWDWAPIYLSPQLQDSEFGTLLNLADQELKSWSQRGDVRYARFIYPDPKDFPFKTTATQWFFEKTLGTSLIFNWNTSGFSTAADYGASSRIISAASTTALPVSYIPPTGDDPKFIRDIRAKLDLDVKGSAIEGSKIGTRYFAQLGDPILARVVQNVFLYQILSETTPFKVTAVATITSSKRSSAVTKILIEETSRWLREATEPGPQQKKALVNLVRTSGLSIPKLAELLAAPDLATRDIVRAASSKDLALESLSRLAGGYDAKRREYDVVYEKRRTEFIRRCKELGGHIEDEADGIVCKYESENGLHANFTTIYDAQEKALGAELDNMEKAFDEAKAAYETAAETLIRVAKQQQTADRVAADLRSRASLADDLDAVLAGVLKATSAIPSDSTIQTPSVVLSCNVNDTASVGGHNIDALPWLAKAGTSKGGAVLRSLADRPTVLVPKEQLGQSTQIARGMVEKSAHVVAVDRPLDEALLLPKQRTSGSFLDLLRATPKLPVTDQALLERAGHCHCNVYVEHGDGDVALLVSLGPPVTARTIFGSSELAAALATEVKPQSRVLFAGFADDQASGLAREAKMRFDGSEKTSNFLEQSTRRAKDLFREGVSQARAIFQLPTQSGKRAMVSLHPDVAQSREVLSDLLGQRPPWTNAEVQRDNPNALVEVVFKNTDQKGALASIEVRPLDAKGQIVKRNDLADTAKATVAGFAKSDRSIESAITRLADQIRRDNSVEEVNFFMKTAGNVRVVRLSREEIERLGGEVALGR